MGFDVYQIIGQIAEILDGKPEIYLPKTME